MLRIYSSDSASQAKKYYVGTPGLEAYYMDNQEFTGYWGGQGAAKLGLKGKVDEKSFHYLCDNINPATGDQLTARNKSNRRVGYDFNFNVPKSVSLAYAFSKDDRIIQAFRQAVYDTMLDVEKAMETRVRKGGKDFDRVTGNLIWAEILHLTARPKDGVADPHMHAHIFVPNATFDSEEGAWKAGQFGDIKTNGAHYQGLFMRRLAKNLREIGLQTVMHENGKGFEIAGFTKSLRKKFSQRTEQILEEAERLGFTTGEQRSGLAALTREQKAKTVLISDLEPLWWARLDEKEKRFLEAFKSRLEASREEERQLNRSSNHLGRYQEVGLTRGDKIVQVAKGRRKERVSVNKATRPHTPELLPDSEIQITPDDRKAVDLAVEHLFSRMSVATERQVITEACNAWRYHEATVEGIKKAVRESNLVRIQQNGKTYLTTSYVIEEENRIIRWCQAGKGSCLPINLGWTIQNEKLNAEQRAAVSLVLTSRDRVVGIRGKSGTGKTTLLREIKAGVEAVSGKLLALAPGSYAAREVLPSEGFENANTIAMLLRSERLQEEFRNAVWLVDEAGMMSNITAVQLFELADLLNARVVLVGDPGQHRPVERGQALDLMIKKAGLEVVTVDKILRQKGAYKRFVEQVQRQDMEAAFETALEMDAIRECSSGEGYRLAAKEYVDRSLQGQNVGVVSPTRAECAEMTKAIRSELHARGLLTAPHPWAILRDQHWTSAEKRDPAHYKPGMVIQINQHLEGYAMGEQMEVHDVRDDVVRLKKRIFGDYRLKGLPLAHPEAFGVYLRDTIELCEGDKIKFICNTRTEDDHRVYTGKSYEIVDFDLTGRPVLKNGWTLGKDCNILDHGYASTSHSCQGKTMDWVLVVQSGANVAAADAKQFYVASSRGKEGMTLYTQNLEDLKETVSKDRQRPMARELMDAVEELSIQLGHVRQEYLGREEGQTLQQQLEEELELNL